jgi:hypothetical protein
VWGEGVGTGMSVQEDEGDEGGGERVSSQCNKYTISE